MKIADIAEFYSEQGGGVYTYVRQKLKASARLGHTTVVIAPGPEDREEPVAGGKIVWVKAPVLPPDPRYHIFVGADRVHAILDRERPDIVEGSSPWRGGWIAGSWRGRARKILVMHADPVAVYPHTFLDRHLSRDRIDSLFGWFWSYLRRLNARFDATIVAGQWLADRFARFGLKNLQVVPFGVDKTLFSPDARSADVRRAMLAACGLDESAALALGISRHHPEKRLPTAIDAVARVNRDRPVGFYLVGDGPARRRIERAAAKAPHVYVAGPVGDRHKLAAMTASADVLLHGSACETFGLVVAEALCAGTPIVVPNTGGAGDLADASYAETYAPGDAADAARALGRLLARDRAALSAAATGGARRRIGDADTHFDRLFALYQRLAG